MITITEQASSVLSESLSEEDRILGKVFRIQVHESSDIHLEKEVPSESDERLKHDGYPVLAVPVEIASGFDSISVDVAPSPEGEGIVLVVKSGGAI